MARKPNGQFENGNTTSQGKRAPGGGRKPDEVKRTLQQLINLAVSDLDWVLIFGKQRDLAISGDVKAAQFLTDRKFGKPKEHIEVSAAPADPTSRLPDQIVDARVAELEHRDR